MKMTGKRSIARMSATTLLLALALLLLGTRAGTAIGAANPVNVTIQIPLTVYDNPCVSEPVALHGDIHILVSSTTDKGGRLHYLSNWNASYSGTGLISDVTYPASERKQESWSASRLPASHTVTSVIKLISKGGTQNAYLYTTMTTTIDANGVPTATMDSVSIDCRG
jgi:hypothetical protein